MEAYPLLTRRQWPARVHDKSRAQFLCVAGSFPARLFFRRCVDIKKNDLMINEEIRDREVRVVGAEGEQLGVMPIAQALALAEEKQLDLVQIVPNARPPVPK